MDGLLRVCCNNSFYFFERQMYLCALSEVQYAAKMKERDQRHHLGISYDVAATTNCQFLLCHSCIHTYRHMHTYYAPSESIIHCICQPDAILHTVVKRSNRMALCPYPQLQ